ncbi:MAG: sterol desaturase family protein [Desulfobacteraceae bacterium]|nr:MAG: sterol desaturase family protein [Desulfobacteraceae bacterium]
MDFISKNEAAIRFAAFFCIFFLVAFFEVLYPRRKRSLTRLKRWFENIGLVAIGTLAVRLTIPVSAAAASAWVTQQGWGLFSLLEIPFWLSVVISIVFLDFIIYLQHVMFHAVPTFWRLHMVHHADLDFDLTTGIRFHPIEIIISMVIKLGSIAVLGAPPQGVIIFEILLNGTAMFNHGNLFIPRNFDGFLRMFLVTPDMHRVHHSVFPNETNSNFGFNLPWWDRIMGTYKAQPSMGHDGMTIGLNQFRDPKVLHLLWMLIAPFTAGQGPYAIGRRGVKQKAK